MHTLVYGVKEFVCLWSTFKPIISGLAEQNGLKKFRTSKAKIRLKKYFFAVKGPVGPGPRAKKATF